MTQTEAQRRAALKYRRGKVKTFTLALYPSDSDIADWLARQPAKAAAVRAAIREYMKRHG